MREVEVDARSESWIETGLEEIVRTGERGVGKESACRRSACFAFMETG